MKLWPPFVTAWPCNLQKHCGLCTLYWITLTPPKPITGYHYNDLNMNEGMRVYLKMKGLVKLRVAGFLLHFSFFLVWPARERNRKTEQDVIIESERMLCTHFELDQRQRLKLTFDWLILEANHNHACWLFSVSTFIRNHYVLRKLMFIYSKPFDVRVPSIWLQRRINSPGGPYECYCGVRITVLPTYQRQTLTSNYSAKDNTNRHRAKLLRLLLKVAMQIKQCSYHTVIKQHFIVL